jgi:hypothetical protein
LSVINLHCEIEPANSLQYISVGSGTAGKFNSRKKRKHQETFLEHGFTYSTIDGEQRPQCLICSEILQLKPVKLKRHVATEHAEFKNKPIAFFERKLKSLCQQKVLIEQHTTAPKRH